MSTRERSIDRGHRLATTDRVRIGNELRVARQILGRSLDSVGTEARLSGPHVGRIERGVVASVSVEQLACIGAIVGLDIRVRAYPGPTSIVDAAQIALLGRLHERLASHLGFRTEVPLPIRGDQRAWDAMIDRLIGSSEHLPVEAEARLIDVQAQVRRIMLKLRDSGLADVLVIVSDTRRNREALAGAASSLLGDFPLPARRVLPALAAGHHPGGSSIILL